MQPQKTAEDMPYGISGIGQAESWFANVVEEGPKGKEHNTYHVLLGNTPNKPMMMLCLSKEGGEYRPPKEQFRKEFLNRVARGGATLPPITTQGSPTTNFGSPDAATFQKGPDSNPAAALLQKAGPVVTSPVSQELPDAD